METKSTKSDILKMLSLFVSTHPNFKVNDDVVEAWHLLFKEYEPELLFLAAKDALMATSYLPTPYYLKEAIKERLKQDMPEALRWTPDEALANAGAKKTIIRKSREYAEMAVPQIDGKHQFHSIEDMHRAQAIRQREWDRAFKEKFVQIKDELFKLVNQGLTYSQAGEKVFMMRDPKIVKLERERKQQELLQ
jgi:hypothetical protein